jgi:hypothetical protein
VCLFLAGSRNTVGMNHIDIFLFYFVNHFIFIESGGKKLNENKLLSGKNSRYSPYTTTFNKCKICKSKIHQPGSSYCQGLY